MLSHSERRYAETIERFIRDNIGSTFRFRYTKDNGESSMREGTYETFRGSCVVMATDKGYRSFHLHGISKLEVIA